MRVVVIVLVFCRILWALDTAEEAAKKAYLANINALMVFTTKDGLNSGTYDFTRANATMVIAHLPLRYHFDPFAEGWNAFFIGGIGYSETKMTSDINGLGVSIGNEIELTATNKLRTYAVGGGGGIRYKNSNGIELLSGLEAIYSRVGVTSRDSSETGEVVEGFFDGSYNDNISYRFFLSLEYRKEWAGFKPYATLSHELYETKSAVDVQQLSTFSSQTNVTSFTIGSETPAVATYRDMNLTFEGYLRGSYLGGDINKVVKFDGYGTVGGVAYWYVTETMNYIERFFLEVSTIQADGLRGYNVGLGFSLDY